MIVNMTIIIRCCYVISHFRVLFNKKTEKTKTMAMMAHCLPNYSTSWPTIVKTPITPMSTDNQTKQLHKVSRTIQFIYRVNSH